MNELHPAKATPSWWGCRRRYEGDTLVIDTVSVRPIGRHDRLVRYAYTEKLHVVERHRLSTTKTRKCDATRYQGKSARRRTL